MCLYVGKVYVGTVKRQISTGNNPMHISYVVVYDDGASEVSFPSYFYSLWLSHSFILEDNNVDLIFRHLSVGKEHG